MSRPQEPQRMPFFNTHITQTQRDMLDWLIRKGYFPDRSEAMRYFLMKGMEPFLEVWQREKEVECR